MYKKVFLFIICILLLTGCERKYKDITVYETKSDNILLRSDKELDIINDMKLRSNDIVKVSDDGYVRLCCDDDIYAFLESGTDAKVHAELNKIYISIGEGEMVVEVRRKLTEDEDFQVVTPNTNMAIRGTVIVVKSERNEYGYFTTGQYVLEGEVTLNGQYTLKEGQGIKIVTDKDHKEIAREEINLDYFDLKDVDISSLRGADGREMVINMADTTSTLPEENVTPEPTDLPNQSVSSSKPVLDTAGAGIYDEDGIMLLSWDELPIRSKYLDKIEHVSDESLSGFVVYGVRGEECSELYYTLQEKLPDQKNLTLRFPDDIVQINSNIFIGVDQISKVILPDALKVIGKNAFNNKYNNTIYNENNIREINLPDGLEYIDAGAFENCAIETITIPESVTYISSHVFCECENLKEVIIPESITEIMGYTFYKCKNLTNVTIPNTVRKIHQYAFACSGIRSECIPDHMLFCDERYIYSRGVDSEYVIVANGAFYKCDNIDNDTRNKITVQDEQNHNIF